MAEPISDADLARIKEHLNDPNGWMEGCGSQHHPSLRGLIARLEAAEKRAEERKQLLLEIRKDCYEGFHLGAMIDKVLAE